MNRKTKERVNFFSMIMGWIFILIGMIGFSATIRDWSFFTVLFVFVSIIGAVLSLMGGLRKWG